MKRFLGLFVVFLCVGIGPVVAEDVGVSGVDDITKILPLRERADVMNGWLKWRLENIIPDLLRREGI
ncbi:MAG: hypothetical protein ABIJ35_01570, partial [Acidobacteriota bacterium]